MPWIRLTMGEVRSCWSDPAIFYFVLSILFIYLLLTMFLLLGVRRLALFTFLEKKLHSTSSLSTQASKWVHTTGGNPTMDWHHFLRSETILSEGTFDWPYSGIRIRTFTCKIKPTRILMLSEYKGEFQNRFRSKCYRFIFLNLPPKKILEIIPFILIPE